MHKQEAQLEADNLVLWHDNTESLISETRRMVGNMVKLTQTPNGNGEVVLNAEYLESFLYANVLPGIVASYRRKFTGPDHEKFEFSPEVQRLAANELAAGLMDEIELGEFGFGAYEPI